MSPELPRLLDYALALAREAGTHTARHFGKPIEVETKSDLSPVTTAYLARSSALSRTAAAVSNG